MSNKKIYAVYDDDTVLLESAKYLVSKGVKIADVYSPFPVHGIDPVIGLKRTNIAIASFIYGMVGVALALFGMYFFMVSDWPINIGGKPNFSLIQNLPSLVPVTFEFGVLCAGHGIAITMMLRNWNLPGMPPKNPYPRTTDDWFAMEITEYGNEKMGLEEIKKLLSETCTIKIDEK